MKLLVKLMVVVLVALLSVPALAGRGSSGRSGGFSHSGAHFSSGPICIESRLSKDRSAIGLTFIPEARLGEVTKILTEDTSPELTRNWME